jgi:hypothetical protein
MARRNSTTKTDEVTEGTAPEATETESTEGTAPEATEPKADDKAEAPIDLTSFKEATAKAVGQRDESTGEVPAEAIAEVNTAYRELDGIKPKNAAKGWIEDEMKAAITALNVQLARAYSMVKDNLSAASGARGEKAPADPTAAFVNKVAAHNLAYNLVVNQVPEGVDGEAALAKANELASGLAEQVQQYLAWATSEAEDKGDAPEVNPVVRTAYKLSQGKASGGGRVSGGSGVRRDVGKHISSAFKGVESGKFLTVAEIAKHQSEEYGTDSPSQGAISARLFPTTGKCTVEGIIPVPAEGDQPRGARKA